MRPHWSVVKYVWVSVNGSIRRIRQSLYYYKKIAFLLFEPCEVSTTVFYVLNVQIRDMNL